MLGLFIAVIIGFVTLLTTEVAKNMILPVVFLACMSFLWKWYMIIGIIQIAIIVLLLTGAVSLGTLTGGKLGFLVTSLVGAGTSSLFITSVIVKIILRTGGAYLMYTSLTMLDTFYTFEFGMLILGAVMLLFAIKRY